jgi:hypothetical protein
MDFREAEYSRLLVAWLDEFAAGVEAESWERDGGSDGCRTSELQLEWK